MAAKKKAPTKPKHATKKSGRTNRTRKRSQPDWAPAFLAELSQRANIQESCVAVGVGRRTVYDRRDADKDFAADMALALETAADALEREAWRRAVEGTRRPVFHKGLRCGQIKEYSDALLSLLLKAHRPDKYRERHEHKHAGGLKVEHASDLGRKILDDPAAADLACRLLERMGPGLGDASRPGQPGQ